MQQGSLVTSPLPPPPPPAAATAATSCDGGSVLTPAQPFCSSLALCCTPSGSMGRRVPLATAAAAALLLAAPVWAACSLGVQLLGAEDPAGAAEGLQRVLLASTPPSGGALPERRAAGPSLLGQLPLNATALRQRLDASDGRLPVIFIPPLGGVQLEMKLEGWAAWFQYYPCYRRWPLMHLFPPTSGWKNPYTGRAAPTGGARD